MEEQSRKEEAVRIDCQRTEQYAAEGRQLSERNLIEERRWQEQWQQDERRRKESQGREISQREAQGEIHEATARTLQDKGRRAAEERTIETAQKRGVPIVPANLSMSGRSQSRPPQEPEQGKPDSPAVERLKEKMEKVKAQTKAQAQDKIKGMEHNRG